MVYQLCGPSHFGAPMEHRIAGEVLAHWLAKASPADRNRLVGRMFDDGNTVTDWRITAVGEDWLEAKPHKSNKEPRRFRNNIMRNGVLVLGSNQKVLANRILSGVDTPIEDQALNSLGAEPAWFRNSEQRLLAACAIMSVRMSQPVAAQGELALYEACRIAQDRADRRAERFLIDYLHRILATRESDGAIAVESRLHVAVVLRHQQDLPSLHEALRLSEFVEEKEWRQSNSSFVAMLCCSRAATLMDLYERGDQQVRLEACRVLLGRAWKHDNNNEEVQAAYRRLNRLSR